MPSKNRVSKTCQFLLSLMYVQSSGKVSRHLKVNYHKSLQKIKHIIETFWDPSPKASNIELEKLRKQDIYWGRACKSTFCPCRVSRILMLPGFSAYICFLHTTLDLTFEHSSSHLNCSFQSFDESADCAKIALSCCWLMTCTLSLLKKSSCTWEKAFRMGIVLLQLDLSFLSTVSCQLSPISVAKLAGQV